MCGFFFLSGFVLFTSVIILTITVILFKLNCAVGEKRNVSGEEGGTVGLGGGGGDGGGRSLPWA